MGTLQCLVFRKRRLRRIAVPPHPEATASNPEGHLVATSPRERTSALIRQWLAGLPGLAVTSAGNALFIRWERSPAAEMLADGDETSALVRVEAHPYGPLEADVRWDGLCAWLTDHVH